MNGGKPCDDHLEEAKGCTMTPCDKEVDCVWGEFGEYSACSRTCGGGDRSRSRLIEVAPRNGGKLCEPLAMTEVSKCNTQPCEETNDCVFGKWTDWDACSCSCNGIRHRVRHIDLFPGRGGKACEGPLREVQHCNFPCEEEEEVKDLAVDCILGDWAAWGECSATCGAAQHIRHRSISRHPENGGAPCVGELAEVTPCVNLPCSTEKQQEAPAVDCLWSEWDDWGACSASCDGGQMVRQRQIKQMGSSKGAPCLDEPSMEVKPCGTQACACDDCSWGTWSSWGACTCTGLVERHRNMQSHFHLCGKPCEGPKVETKSCTPSCQAEPVECEMTMWSSWTSCTVSCGGGEIKRSRKIKREPANGGKSCDGILEEVAACNEQECDNSSDCVLSEWNEWTACTVSCGGGQQFQDRHVMRESMNGGKACTDNLKTVRVCNDTPCGDSRDCKWGQWSEWGACSQKCGGGNKVRDRSVEIAPRKSGKMCEALSKSEMTSCNTQPCGEGCRDAEWGPWGSWDICSASCGHGFRKRERNIATSANACGKALDGLMQDFEECNTPCTDEEPIDCQFSEWSDYGDCSCSCDGVHDRSRRISVFAANGGHACTGPMKEVGSCNVGACNTQKIQNCIVSEWSSWTVCSVSCGSGIQDRERSVTQEPIGGGEACPEVLKQISGCNEHPCARNVDCKWGEWVTWGSCTRECDGGQKIRYRQIETLPKHEGKECQKADSVEMAPCNEQKCGVKMYCEFNDWTEWGDCNTTCGSGQQVRRRSLVLSAVREENVLVTGHLNQLITMSFSQLSWFQILSVFVGGMLFALLTMSLVLRMRRRRTLVTAQHEQLLLEE